MEIEKITPDGICHITMKGKPTFKKGVVDGNKIKMEKNSLYMMNAYQTKWPQLMALVGRIDGRYAGVISYNICYPDKYLNFEKDMKRFENDNRYEWLFAILCANLFAFKAQYVVMLMPLMLMLSMTGNRDYVRLHADDHPHLFDISKPFIAAPESFPEGFFNAGGGRL